MIWNLFSSSPFRTNGQQQVMPKFKIHYSSKALEVLSNCVRPLWSLGNRSKPFYSHWVSRLGNEPSSPHDEITVRVFSSPLKPASSSHSIPRARLHTMENACPCYLVPVSDWTLMLFLSHAQLTSLGWHVAGRWESRFWNRCAILTQLSILLEV